MKRFFCAATAIFSTSAAFTKLVPLVDFLKRSEFSELELSPHGDYIAVTREDANGNTVLNTIRLKDEKVAGGRLSEVSLTFSFT